MSLALLPLLNVELVDRIHDYIPADADDIEWETLYGWTTIYQTKHYITYGGGPEGGYVYFFRERQAGWYRWSRDWMQEPKYELITTGQIAIRHSEDEDENIAILPPDWEEQGYGEDDDIMIMDSFFMEQEAEIPYTNGR